MLQHSLGGIKGLHKMWRSRSQEEIEGNVSTELLPYIGSYADILIEGKFQFLIFVFDCKICSMLLN